MKTPFIKTYRKKLQNKRKEDIIDLFLTNISGTHYSKVERENDSKLIIKGIFFKSKKPSYEPFQYINFFMDLWVGLCRKAELYFEKNNDIVYSIDYTYGVVWLFIVLIVSIFPVLFVPLNMIAYYYIGFVALMLILGVFLIVFRLFLHRQVFVKTLNNKNTFKGNYDWDKILKSKTDNELKNIANRNTTITIEVQKMAKEELMRREKIK